MIVELEEAVLDLLIGFATRLNALQPDDAMDEIRTRGSRFTAVIRTLVDRQCAQTPP